MEVSIALVGKYIKLEDAYTSVKTALEHAAFKCCRKLTIQVGWLLVFLGGGGGGGFLFISATASYGMSFLLTLSCFFLQYIDAEHLEKDPGRTNAAWEDLRKCE